MGKLCCDICGGSLEMQAEGTSAVCELCGTKYGIARLRKKWQETGGRTTARTVSHPTATATGAAGQLDNWRTLVRKYYTAGDFFSAEELVKKILEALPEDAEANRQYQELQVLKYTKVRNGVLEKYTGDAETLVLPDIITQIGYEAFYRCSGLQSVTLPGSIERIGDRAFCGCTSLQSITLPSSITQIGDFAFWGCFSLQSIILPNGITRIGEVAFKNCSALTSITLPRGITEIGTGAFCSCSNLQSIALPDSVTQIGNYAFCNCHSLQSASIPTSASLGEHCFSGCRNLSWVPLADKRITGKAFSGTPVLSQKWKNAGLCPSCGGTFEGFFSVTCKRCHRKKDF